MKDYEYLISIYSKDFSYSRTVSSPEEMELVIRTIKANVMFNRLEKNEKMRNFIKKFITWYTDRNNQLDLDKNITNFDN